VPVACIRYWNACSKEVSFSAGDLAAGQNGETLKIDAAYVDKHLGELAVNEDLSSVHL